mmetsp:Transcript_16720/g.51451  ORF Transcript_16720/g.51451 Transcript_16720/m.51451 type:complete len:253 (+) Transcript_16720:496-1254(+)
MLFCGGQLLYDVLLRALLRRQLETEDMVLDLGACVLSQSHIRTGLLRRHQFSSLLLVSQQDLADAPYARVRASRHRPPPGRCDRVRRLLAARSVARRRSLRGEAPGPRPSGGSRDSGLTHASEGVRPGEFSLAGRDDLKRALEASGLGERPVDCVDLSREGTGPARLVSELYCTVGELQVASSEVPEPQTDSAGPPRRHVIDEFLPGRASNFAAAPSSPKSFGISAGRKHLKEMPQCFARALISPHTSTLLP